LILMRIKPFFLPVYTPVEQIKLGVIAVNVCYYFGGHAVARSGC